MLVKIVVILDVEEQDSTKDGIEAAKNQLRSMEFEEILELATYVPQD